MARVVIAAVAGVSAVAKAEEQGTDDPTLPTERDLRGRAVRRLVGATNERKSDCILAKPQDYTHTM